MGIEAKLKKLLAKFDDSPFEDAVTLNPRYKKTIEELQAYINSLIVEARTQGWHEGRAAANNPEYTYDYKGDEELSNKVPDGDTNV